MRRAALSVSVVLVACAKPEAAARATWAELESASLAAVEDAPLELVDGPRDWDLRVGVVLTAEGARHAPGRVVVREGRIAWVGPSGQGPDCPTCVRLDDPAGFLTPGLIDTHSHLGVYPSPGVHAHEDGNEATAPTTPGVWAEASVWPGDPGFQRALAGGVTTLQILPGSANLIGGRGVTMRPIPARGGRAMRFPGAPETIKMACGENPKRVYGQKGGPSTRMGNVRGYREAFFAAKAYDARWRAADAGEGEPPDRDADLDTLVGLLRGTTLAQVHCYRADDMLTFLQVAEEAGFAVRSFHHALEAYKIRDVLAERNVSSSTWDDWWGFKLEAWDGVQPNAAMLAVAGARAVIHSDSPIGIQRLNQEAGKAWEDGKEAGFVVSEDEALRWITLHAAWTLGIDDQTGSIAPGKRADLVLWTAHPFSTQAWARLVLVDGVLAWDRDQAPDISDFEVGR